MKFHGKAFKFVMALLALAFLFAVSRSQRAMNEFRAEKQLPRTEQIESARAELEALENTLETSRLEYNRVRALVEERVSTEARLDRADGAVKVGTSNVRAAEARLAELLEGTTLEELGQARASVAEADAIYARIQLLADRLVIHAPRAGRIDAIPYKLGERPPVGATIIVMMADGAPYARVYIPEPLRAGVTPGLAASIVVDGVDGTLTSAEVTMVSKTQTSLSDHDAEMTLRLLDRLEELDDVHKVYTNADFPEEVLERYRGE